MSDTLPCDWRGPSEPNPGAQTACDIKGCDGKIDRILVDADTSLSLCSEHSKRWHKFIDPRLAFLLADWKRMVEAEIVNGDK